MGWTFLDNEIDIASLITYGAAFNDVNLETVVPYGTTFVQLHLRNTGASNLNVFTRYNGGSQDYKYLIYAGEHSFYCAFLDGNRVFEGYFEHADIAVGITAYSSTPVAITPMVNVTPSTDSAYTDKDLSGSIPSGGTMAIIQHRSLGRSLAMRPDGSAMDYYVTYGAPTPSQVLYSGLSTGRIYEYCVASGYSSESLWLSGYDTAYVPLDDKILMTIGSNNAWVDCDASALPVGALAAHIVKVNSAYTANYITSLRPKTTSPDDFTQKELYNHQVQALVKLDSSRVFQAYVGDYTKHKVYVVGYIPGVTTNLNGIMF
jgi:hypothetical protein